MVDCWASSADDAVARGERRRQAGGVPGRASLFILRRRGGGGLDRLRYDGYLVVDLERLEQRVVGLGGGRGRLALVHHALGHHAMRRVHVVLELFVHSKGSCAYCALV